MLKLAVISDVHYYSETLGNSGRAYEIRSATDQKCLAESGAILDAALAEIAASDCDALLVAGDMSNDGEIVSHNEEIITWEGNNIPLSLYVKPVLYEGGSNLKYAEFFKMIHTEMNNDFKREF